MRERFFKGEEGLDYVPVAPGIVEEFSFADNKASLHFFMGESLKKRTSRKTLKRIFFPFYSKRDPRY